MPWIKEWLAPEVAFTLTLEGEEVEVFHTYVNNEAGATCTFWYTLADDEECQDDQDHFDLRDLIPGLWLPNRQVSLQDLSDKGKLIRKGNILALKEEV